MALVAVRTGTKTAPEADAKGFRNKCMNNWNYLTVVTYMWPYLEEIRWFSGIQASQPLRLLGSSRCPSLGRGKQGKAWVYFFNRCSFPENKFSNFNFVLIYWIDFKILFEYEVSVISVLFIYSNLFSSP